MKQKRLFTDLYSYLLIPLFCSLFAALLAQPILGCEPYMCPQNPNRVALVIGNENYTNLSRLPSARTDALKMKEKLTDLGFDVSFFLDVATVEEFENVVYKEFEKKIHPGDFVVFYFSGHGFSQGSGNFLVPAQMPSSLRDSQVPEYAISIEAFESLIAESRPGLIMFFTDACRGLGGFKIGDEQGNNVAREGHIELPSRNKSDFDKGDLPQTVASSNAPIDYFDDNQAINSIIVYPTKAGYVVEGRDDPERMSIFTQVLHDSIALDGQPFNKIFGRMRALLNFITKGKQVPFNNGFSSTDPYFKPTARILEEEKEIWSSTLETRDYTEIRVFFDMYSVSSYSTACRKWLIDNRKNEKPSPFTRISPLAVDRAWRSSDKSLVGVRSSAIQLAFPRSLEKDQVEKLQEAPDSQIGITQSRASEKLSDRAKFSAENIKTHGIAVATQNLKALAKPNTSAAIVENINSGARLKINDTIRIDDNNIYLNATTVEDGKSFFIKIEPVAAPEFVLLGQPLTEIVVRSRPESIPGLVNPDTINEVLAELKAQNWNITWVSLSTAQASPEDDPNEQNIRSLQMANTEYLLKKMGIDGKRITSISGNEDFSGEGVRIRFFGTK